MPAENLDQLAASYRHGDAASLRPLVEALARPLLAQAHRYVRDWDTAADLVQETWLRVVARIADYDPARRFRPWIAGILRYLCLDHLRKIARLPVTTSAVVGDEMSSSRPSDNPETAVSERDVAHHLGQALARLGPTQREVFARVEIEREDRGDVARAMEITPGNLRVNLHLARRRLAELLTEEDLL